MYIYQSRPRNEVTRSQGYHRAASGVSLRQAGEARNSFQNVQRKYITQFFIHLGPGLKWHTIKDATEQLAVSPSGMLVWRVHNNSLYVATKISTRQPAGSKWVEAAREVAHVSVDDNVGWYVWFLFLIFLITGLPFCSEF